MAAIIAPNADLAFMLAIGWTAINLLMSGFFITYQQVRVQAADVMVALQCICKSAVVMP